MVDALSDFAREFGVRPRLAYIDYAELIRASGNGEQRVERIFRDLKAFAKDEKVAVWVAHQTNRAEPEWAEPSADSARHAGYTESDLVVGIWRPGLDPDLSLRRRQELDGLLHMKIIKNRLNGRMNVKPWRFWIGRNLRLIPAE